MRVSMICIGDELLDGRVADQNTRQAGQVLGELGLELERVTLLGDDPAALVEELAQAASRDDVVLVSGGLGPTQDDVTRQVAAQLLGVSLVLDPRALERMEERFAARGLEVTPNNHRQCLFPQGSQVLLNEVGSASGFMAQHQGAQLFFMPGVPRECAWFLSGPIRQQLSSQAQGAWPLRRRLEVFGLAESHVEAKLDGIEALARAHGAKVAYCARAPIVELTLKARSPEGLRALEHLVHARLGSRVVGQDDEDLVGQLARLLTQRGERVTTAESCTGGGVAQALTGVAGSSGWFDMAWVTYSDQAKQRLVGVSPEALAARGAVSARVAAQLALGARHQAGSTYGLSVTGIAGPSGATPGKPVGTVCFGLSAPEGVYVHRELLLGRTREQVRQVSVYTALAILLWRLRGQLDGLPALSGPWSEAQVWDLSSGLDADEPLTEPAP